MFTIAINILLVIHVLVSLLIIFVVLMQRPKNEGLGAAFGGGMTENLFGAQTTNVLQTMTRYLGGIFFALTLMLSWLYVKQTSGRSTLQQRLLAPTKIPQPAATPLPPVVPAPESKAPGATPGPEATKPAAPPKPESTAPATPTPSTPAAATPTPATPA